MKSTRGSNYLRVIIYVLIFLVGLLIFIFNNETTKPYSELFSKVGLAVMVSTGIQPLISLTVDHALKLHNDTLLKDASKNESLKKLGIIEISPGWQQLVQPAGHGLDFRELLREFIVESRWYIVTINPRGLSGDFFRESVIQALKNGTVVKWAYLKMPESNKDEKEKTLRDWWVSRYEMNEEKFDYDASLESIRRNHAGHLSGIKDEANLLVSRAQIKDDAFQIYENTVPTTYLGLLAIRNLKEKEEKITKGKLLDLSKPGLIMVHPYQMYHLREEVDWGMILGNGGELYNQYATSILRFFSLGQELGHLHKVWPNSISPK